MQSLSGWLLSVFGAIVISVIIDLLFSGSKMSRFIRCICASVTLLIIVTPIASIQRGEELSFNFSSYSPTLDENYLSYIDREKAMLIEKEVENMLLESGVTGAKVRIELVNGDNESQLKTVEINLSESVIDEKFGHINRNEQVRKLVSKFLSVDESVVTVYGGEES